MTSTVLDAYLVLLGLLDMWFAEALPQARDQVRAACYVQEDAETALQAGSPSNGKRVANARHERTREENLRVAAWVWELEVLVNPQ